MESFLNTGLYFGSYTAMVTLFASAFALALGFVVRSLQALNRLVLQVTESPEEAAERKRAMEAFRASAHLLKRAGQ